MIFNPENTGHIDGTAPLFLGESLGVMDTINVRYPVLEELYQLQVAQIWNEFEVDLTQDRLDMQTLPRPMVELMVKTIMWQHVADSIAARSIVESFGGLITNSEFGNLAQLWSFFEVIHARTYSHIIKQTFTEPNETLAQLYAEAQVLQRSNVIVQVFEDMQDVKAAYNDGRISVKTVRKQIIKTLAALAALESIAFMSSFAVTFALVKRDVFAGIGQLVKLIARDEVLHTRFSYTALKILKETEGFKEVWHEVSFEVETILNAVVEQELAWADYLFSEEREVIGLNAGLLKDYTLYMSRPLYQVMDVPFLYQSLKHNPLSYMDEFIDSRTIQAAAQEIQLTNYKVGAVIDDTTELDLTDEGVGL